MKSIFNSKFFIVLTLCMGIFGCTAFAVTAPNGQDYSYYVRFTNGGSKWEAFSNSPINYKNGGSSILNDDTYFFRNGSYFGCYKSGESFNWDKMGDIYEEGPSVELPGVEEDEEDEDVVIPGEDVVAPGEDVDSSVDLDISDSVKTIPNDLINNLKFLVPMGVGLLALFIGVSLIPRIVYKFL